MKSYYRPDFDAHQAPYHRAQRRRRLLGAARRGGVALAAAAAIGLAAAAWSSLGPGWVRARIAGLGLFRIQTIQVTGNLTLSGSDVLAAAGLGAGDDLLALDLDVARERLLALPRLREARLRRRLPGTIVVEVTERVPCVVVRADRDLLADAEGKIVAPASFAEAAGLPVLKGVETAGGAVTARGAADLAAGIELVAAIRAAGFPALAAIDHIDLQDPNDAVIVPVAGRPLVHAGRGDAVLRLRRWRAVAPDMAQRWPELEYVDLRAQGQVVAMPAAPAPATEAGAEDATGEPGAPKPAARPERPGTGAGAGRAPAGGGHA